MEKENKVVHQQIADVQCMRWVKAIERLPKDDKLYYNAIFNDEPCVMKVEGRVVVRLQFASGGVYSNPNKLKLRCTEWLEYYYEAKEVPQDKYELYERALDVSTDQIIRTQKERNEKDEEIKRLREALEQISTMKRNSGEDWVYPFNRCYHIACNALEFKPEVSQEKQSE